MPLLRPSPSQLRQSTSLAAQRVRRGHRDPHAATKLEDRGRRRRRTEHSMGSRVLQTPRKKRQSTRTVRNWRHTTRIRRRRDREAIPSSAGGRQGVGRRRCSRSRAGTSGLVPTTARAKTLNQSSASRGRAAGRRAARRVGGRGRRRENRW